MTALKTAAIAEFLRNGGNSAAALVYGPDLGLVRERAETLAKSVVADIKDPFNSIELSDSDLKSEPGRLVDESAALSFMGGRRVVRVKAAGEAASAAAKALLDALDQGRLRSNALVVIEAGDLAKSSALRKAFEASKHGVAVPCYSDGPAELRALALAAARAEDLKFDGDALDLLVAMLGDDRALSRSEIEKLLLFKGLKGQRQGPGTIGVEDVRAMLADGVGEALGEAASFAADGAFARLEAALFKSSSAGASPIGLLRALQREMSRLRDTQALIAEGLAPAAAMQKLRPPVFFMEQRSFETRLRKWAPPRLNAALDLLVEAELEAKTTGAPQQEIAERAAFRIAAMAH
jgi:DNA polymerase-3 subunit delta